MSSQCSHGMGHIEEGSCKYFSLGPKGFNLPQQLYDKCGTGSSCYLITSYLLRLVQSLFPFLTVFYNFTVLKIADK